MRLLRLRVTSSRGARYTTRGETARRRTKETAVRRMLMLLALAALAAMAIGTATVLADDGSDDNGSGDTTACTAPQQGDTSSGRDDRVLFREDSGTRGDDNEQGTSGDDNEQGDEGNDELNGEAGDDHLDGDQGDD